MSVKLFASEIQSVATRATATSLAQSANCVGAYDPLHFPPFNSLPANYPISDLQLLRRLHYPRPPRPLLIRHLFPIRSLFTRNHPRKCNVYA